MNSSAEQLCVILQGCRKKERNSEEALYHLFFDFAMAVCYRYARTEEDAIEIVQDGFLKVFNGVHHFQVPERREAVFPAFKNWLKKIMIYTAIDHFRARKKTPGSDQLEQYQYKLAATDTSAPDKLMYDELIALVQNLTPAYRAVFNLFVIDGFTHEEIANLLNITPGASKSNLFKARENLKKMLKITYKELYTRYE